MPVLRRECGPWPSLPTQPTRQKVTRALSTSLATVSSLSGETLTGSSTSPTNFGLCPTATYTVSGTASGPYPGTFVQTGTINGPTLTATTFTITSAGTGDLSRSVQHVGAQPGQPGHFDRVAPGPRRQLRCEAETGYAPAAPPPPPAAG
jgi:hypothetical protein